MLELFLHTCLFAIAAYVVASVNLPIVLHGLGFVPDPRQFHSRNPGVSNVYRTAGPWWAVVVLLLDTGRAAGVALLAHRWLPAEFLPAVGAGLVSGNRWPLFHGFRGGKGVSSYLGFCLGLVPWVAASSAVSWVIAYGLTRQSFIGSFVMVLVLAGGAIAWSGATPPAVAGTALILLMIVEAHRSNITSWRRAQDAVKDG